MEPDGEPRGTANTVTDGQRIDRLEDMVREIYSHFFSDRYPNGDTPGRSGNVSTGSMDFDAVKNAVDEESAVEIENAVDEESAAEIAIDEKSIVPTSDEESVVPVESLYETYNVGYNRPIAVVEDSLPLALTNGG